ncbi:MAG: YadA-like family protein, partial [Pyramidobacter sp.]|nr:YadA-like family protein [Pyramidobacter sp.]
SVANVAGGKDAGAGYDVLLDDNSSETGSVWVPTDNAIAVGNRDIVTRRIVGVAAGHDDTDAVNVAQLKKVAEAIGEGGSGGSWNLAIENSDPGKIPSGKTVRLNVEQNEGTSLLELKDNDKGENGERTVTWVVADAPTFGGNVTAQSFTAGDIVINDKKGNINMGGKKITNVAPGVNDTDAVNVSQLNNSGWNLTVNDDKVEKKSKVANNGTVRMQVQQPADTDLLTLTDTVNDKGERVVSWVVTDTPVISSLTTKGTFTSSGPAVFEGPVTMKENLNMSGKQIKNLAWATDDNDAVPYGQLKDYVQNTGNNLSFLNNKIERGLAHVGSRAAALAALHPLDYDPDKPTSIMAGFGHYKGDSSVALGVAHHFNDDTLLTVGSTVGHETMVNVGLSLRLGRNTNMTEKRWKVQRHTAVDYDARLKVMERRYKDLQLDKDAEIAGLRQRLQFLEEEMKAMRGVKRR